MTTPPSIKNEKFHFSFGGGGGLVVVNEQSLISEYETESQIEAVC